MGMKRPSVRTLKTGQKVMHLPPSQGFDEGHEVLMPGQSPLIAYLDERERQLRAQQDELKAARGAQVRRKCARMDADPSPVPPDKRPV